MSWFLVLETNLKFLQISLVAEVSVIGNRLVKPFLTDYVNKMIQIGACHTHFS
jgi:hypothetical protein